MGGGRARRSGRRKRKRRPSGPARNGGRATPSRSELKNRAAREALQPLREGERPTAVSVGAAVVSVMAAILWVSAALTLTTEIEVEGSQPRVLPLVVLAAVLTAMAYGMWRARYWAVLGFQALLALIMLSAALGLVQVETLLQALGTVLILAGAAVLFYFMVKAMARIQMPRRLPPE